VGRRKPAYASALDAPVGSGVLLEKAMRSTYLLLSPLNADQAFFHKAKGLLVRMGRLTPNARMVIADGEALVEQGDALYTIERVSKCAVALRGPDEREIGRWLV